MSTPKGRAAQASGSPTEPSTFAEAYAKLNPQRRKFVASYLERPDGPWAARQAGYASRSARNQAYRLLREEDVKAALRLGWSEAGMVPEEILARTEEVVRVTIEDFYSYDIRQERPYMYRPVRELLEELFTEISFEEKFAERAALGGKELKAHAAAQLARRREATRMELEMERDPNAVRWVPGPPVLREVPRLDLAKARDLGVLHLAKGMEPTRHGLALRLQDPERARELMGKVHGLWRADDEGGDDTSGLDELVQLMAERKRQRDEERGRG